MAVNQLKAGAILSYVLIFLNNIVGIAYTPFLIRSLGQSEFGLYSIAAATVGYLTIMDLGFGNAIIRFTAKYRALGDKETENNLHGMFTVIYTVLGVIVAMAGCIMYFNADNLFASKMTFVELEKIKILIALLTFNLAISFPFSIFGSIITAHENFIFSKLVNICRVVINPLIMIPLLFLGYKSIALVVVITVLNLTTLFMNFYYCKKKIGIAPTFGYFDKTLFMEILGYSFFIFLEAIVNQIYWNTGQFILGAVAGTVMVAIFAVAITIKNLYFSFSTSIVGVLLPKVTKMITENAPTQKLSEIFIRVGRLQYIILSFILTGFILFGKVFIELWAGKNYSESYLMVLCIIVPVTIPLIQNLGITILQAKNQQKFRSVLYVMIAIVNVLVSIPLAKEIGGLGCAIVTGMSLFIGNGIIMNIYYYKKIKLDIYDFWKQILKMTIPIIGTVGVFLVYDYFVNNEYSLLNYLSSILLFSMLFMMSMWFFGINEYEKNIFKSFMSKIKILKI